eukprot:gene11068-12236_t
MTKACDCSKDCQMKTIVLKVIFLLSIAFGLVCCGLMVRFGVFDDKYFEQAPGDFITPEVLTSYCKEISIKSANKYTHFTVYVNPGIPEFSKKRHYYHSGTTFYITSWSFQIWKIHLLKGSTVDMNVCADQYLMFYIIKGEKFYTEWSQTTLFSKYLYKSRILPEKDCTKREAYHKQMLTATESDFYYIMFSSSVGWRFLTRVSAMMIFNRTVFNTSNATYKCQNKGDMSNTCTVPLRYNSNDTVMIHFTPTKPEQSPNMFQKDKIQWHPVPRVVYYLEFFGGIFGIVLILTILYSIWRCIARTTSVIDEDKIRLLPTHKRVFSDSTGSVLKVTARKTTRATLGSFIVVNNQEKDDNREEEVDEDKEDSMAFNESDIINISYLTDEQMQNQCLTATGISAI